MHILLTNDDGPPNPTSSPHIALFAQILSAPPHNHTVSVVLPSTQRSWIGKAHILPPSSRPALPSHAPSADDASDLVTPTYYDPAAGTTTPHRPATTYFVLVPGTPATCVQLGLFHTTSLFPNDPARAAPIDLVVSGPNHGRNTTAAFGLSSGTLGGALEASIVGWRAIAVSLGIFDRALVDETKEDACRVAARIVDTLALHWTRLADECVRPEAHLGMAHAPDVYSVNIPLVRNVGARPVKWAWMLDNKWENGSLYKKEEDETEDEKAGPSFKWAPAFVDLLKTYATVPEGSDGRIIRDECVTVTPLRANFENVSRAGGRFEGEFKL